MLIITRKKGEQINIGNDITVSVIEIKGAQVKLGVEAPRSIGVHRREIYEKIREQNMKASTVNTPDFERAIDLFTKTR